MRLSLISALLTAALTAPAIAQPLSTTFTYQGRLDSAGVPANGTYDLRFSLFDDPTSGNQVGASLCAENVQVVEGLFTVQLDFPGAFAGQQRYLETWVRQDLGTPCSNTGGYTILNQRQPLTAAPYAAFSLNAGTLNNEPASFYTNASNLSSGTLPDARLPANLPRLNAANTFTATNQFNAFTGINRNGPISGAENFGIQNTAIQTGYVGMYISSNSQTGLPFYGYGANGTYAWTMLDSAGTWSLFNNGLAFSVAINGNASFGTTPTTSRLTVGGTTTSTDFAFSTPLSATYSVDAAAFSARDGVPVSHNQGGGGAFPNSATVAGLGAPVNLPHGATITAVRFLFIDNSATSDLVMSMYAYSATSSGYSSVSSPVTSAGASSAVQTLASAGLNYLVDNNSYSFVVLASPTTSWSGNAMQIRGVRVEYTLPRPAR